MNRSLDLNADLAEGFAVYDYGADSEIMPLITSANVACGFHAGDPRVIQQAVELAAAHDVRIGAHVGLPDRLGFGRRVMDISPEDAYAYTLYQIGALDGFLRPHGITMTHVKPHGALYMMVSSDALLADSVAAAIAAFDQRLFVYALPASQLAIAAGRRGLAVIPEFFADRPYTGTDVAMFGWDYADIGRPVDAADRVEKMLWDPAFDAVRTICVHSDTRDAPEIMSAVRTRILDAGFKVGLRTGPSG